MNEQRERWLNPPEWVEPLAARVDAPDDFADVPAEARPLVRQSAIMAAAAKDLKLKKRTLTNLYNERPTWLKLAHEALDRAVLAAYAATDPGGDWPEDWAAVWIDTGAGQPLPADHPLAAKRAEVDQPVLANLLRLNHTRDERQRPSRDHGRLCRKVAAMMARRRGRSRARVSAQTREGVGRSNSRFARESRSSAGATVRRTETSASVSSGTRSARNRQTSV